MKSYLLYPDRDYVRGEVSEGYQDLWFDTIINHLCVYDKYIKDIYLDSKNLMTTDPAVIKYRQDILKDFIKNKDVVLNLYQFINELLTELYNERFEMIPKHITLSYTAAIRISKRLTMALENMNRYYEKYNNSFKSMGFRGYMDRFRDVFSMEYIKRLNMMFDRLKFPKGYYVKASLDDKLDIANLELYSDVSGMKEEKKKLQANGVQLRNKVSILPTYDIEIKEDKKWKHAKTIENPKALATSEEAYNHFTDEALISVAPSVCNLVNDIVEYLKKTREEMAFYIGAINLYDKLMKKGLPICTPKPYSKEECVFKCDGLYDVALALQSNDEVVGNTLDSQGRSIMFITGANQGGKTTFLRSYGQAIIMMQLGLFVSGKSFESNTFTDIFTHFNKEEDKTMESGKLDEELSRLDSIMSSIKKGSLMLFNESFQSTAEREGSTIAFDIIRALHEKDIAVVSVSHMYYLYTLLDDLYGDKDIYYLRATREETGERSYKLVCDKPLRTSFALDLYKEIF